MQLCRTEWEAPRPPFRTPSPTRFEGCCDQPTGPSYEFTFRRTRTRLLRLHRLLEPRRRDRGGRDSEHAPGEPALAQVFRDAVSDRRHLELGVGDLFQELVRIDALALRPELAEQRARLALGEPRVAEALAQVGAQLRLEGP